MSNLEAPSEELLAGRRELHAKLAADNASARAARRQLETLAPYLGGSELRLAALLTTELVSNSVKHSGTGPEGVVELDVSLDRRLLRVEVRDDGPGFEPAPRTTDSPPDSQWGLHLVDELSDRWGVSPNGKVSTVWFELDLTPPR